jgi:hypothetical protein
MTVSPVEVVQRGVEDVNKSLQANDPVGALRELRQTLQNLNRNVITPQMSTQIETSYQNIQKQINAPAEPITPERRAEIDKSIRELEDAMVEKGVRGQLRVLTGRMIDTGLQGLQKGRENVEQWAKQNPDAAKIVVGTGIVAAGVTALMVIPRFFRWLGKEIGGAATAVSGVVVAGLTAAAVPQIRDWISERVFGRRPEAVVKAEEERKKIIETTTKAFTAFNAQPSEQTHRALVDAIQAERKALSVQTPANADTQARLTFLETIERNAKTRIDIVMKQQQDKKQAPPSPPEQAPASPERTATDEAAKTFSASPSEQTGRLLTEAIAAERKILQSQSPLPPDSATRLQVLQGLETGIKTRLDEITQQQQGKKQAPPEQSNTPPVSPQRRATDNANKIFSASPSQKTGKVLTDAIQAERKVLNAQVPPSAQTTARLKALSDLEERVKTLEAEQAKKKIENEQAGKATPEAVAKTLATLPENQNLLNPPQIIEFGPNLIQIGPQHLFIDGRKIEINASRVLTAAYGYIPETSTPYSEVTLNTMQRTGTTLNAAATATLGPLTFNESVQFTAEQLAAAINRYRGDILEHVERRTAKNGATLIVRTRVI